jgi:hypothetical protein
MYSRVAEKIQAKSSKLSKILVKVYLPRNLLKIGASSLNKTLLKSIHKFYLLQQLDYQTATQLLVIKIHSENYQFNLQQSSDKANGFLSMTRKTMKMLIRLLILCERVLVS